MNSAVAYHWKLNSPTGGDVGWTGDWNNDQTAHIFSGGNVELAVPVVYTGKDKLVYIVERGDSSTGIMHGRVWVNSAEIDRFKTVYNNPFATHHNNKRFQKYIATKVPAHLINFGDKFIKLRIETTMSNYHIYFREIGTHDYQCCNIANSKIVVIRGFVKSFVTGQNIPDELLRIKNAKVVFRRNNGKEYIATLSAGSLYQIVLPAGPYESFISMDDFNSKALAMNLVDDSSERNRNNHIFIKPKLVKWKLVLTFAPVPKAHVKTPDGDVVNFKRKKSTDGKVNMDEDARPETIVIEDTNRGVYKYYVKNSETPVPLTKSLAKVTFTKDGTLVQDIEVPSNGGNESVWNVLEINTHDNTYKIFNTLQNNDP